MHRVAFASRKELFAATVETMTDVPKETMHHVFNHQMEWLTWVSQHNVDYCPLLPIGWILAN
jgi:hypothetical protein